MRFRSQIGLLATFFVFFGGETTLAQAPQPGPVGWYSFDVPGQPGFDSAGGHHAIHVEYVAQEPGVVGLAGRFTQGYMLLPRTPDFDLKAGDFTLSVWVNSTPAAMNRNWFTKGFSITVGGGTHIYGLAGNDIVGFAFDGGPGGGVQSTSIVMDGTWHHIAGVKRGALIELWVDGIREAVNGYSINSFDTGGFAIGRDGECCEWFTGLMDEAKIWNRALTPQEIAAEAGLTAPQPPFPQITGISPAGVRQGTTSTITIAGSDLLAWTFALDATDITSQVLSQTDNIVILELAVQNGAAIGQRQLVASNGSIEIRQPDAYVDVLRGYSNIAFLPGFMASDLYDGPERLWLPDALEDVCRLQPDRTGHSIQPLSTRNIVEDAYQVKDIYGDFASLLDGLRGTTFNDWRPFPYDWRLAIDEVLSHGVLLGDPPLRTSLLEGIEDLANRSATLQVTIIAHSNGGLLAKTLLSHLDAQGKSDLIDRLILVAVPQLGTPKAVASLLHGFDQDIGVPLNADLFASARLLREAGENMIGAYTLLPAKSYFNRVTDIPLVSFQGASAQYFGDLYGQAIWEYGNDTSGFRAYLLGTDRLNQQAWSGPCEEADAVDLNVANALSPVLLDHAEALHTGDDSWQVPGVEVIQIVGDGFPTPASIEYDCAACPTDLTVTLPPTQSGDGTVVIDSAAALSAPTYYIDLHGYNDSIRTSGNVWSRKHDNFLGVTSLHALIRELLDGNMTPNIQYVSVTPVHGINYMRATVHSPANIHAFDLAGHHTGLAPTANPLVFSVEEQIPNSALGAIGEAQYLLLDTLERYHIELHGTALGTFDLVLEEFIDETPAVEETFLGIPVTSHTRATLAIQHLTGRTELQIDVDADGQSDAIFRSDTPPDPALLLVLLDRILNTLPLEAGTLASLDGQLQVTLQAVERQNLDAARGSLGAFLNYVDAQVGKNIPTIVAQGLSAIAMRILNIL